MVKLLLEHGCDPKKKNKKKQNLRDVCKENSEILGLIRDRFNNNNNNNNNHNNNNFNNNNRGVN